MKLQRISIVDSVFNNPEPIDFVILGLEAGAVGFLTGAGSSGKGFFALQLAFSVADTTESLNFLNLCNEKRGKVGFLTAEDGEKVLKNRIYNIGQYYLRKSLIDEDTLYTIDENLEIVSLRGKMPTIYSKNERNYNIVEAWKNFLINFAIDKRLLIIDTFRRFFDGEENSSGDVTEALKFFEYVADKTGCAILITHHTNKMSLNGENNDEQVSIRGSSAIADNARFIISIAKMSKNQLEKYNIDESMRSFWVQVDMPKVNYSQPMPKKWLFRTIGGVLEEVVLQEVKKGGNNGKKF